MDIHQEQIDGVEGRGEINDDRSSPPSNPQATTNTNAVVDTGGGPVNKYFAATTPCVRTGPGKCKKEDEKAVALDLM